MPSDDPAVKSVLDETFDSLDAAQEAALEWIELQRLVEPGAALSERQAALCLHFGIEVSTSSGDWRTLRHAAPPALASPARPLALPHG